LSNVVLSETLQEVQEKWTSYSDPLFGIKVNYPNDWMLVQDSSDHLRLKNATITTLMTIDVKDTAPDETLDKLTRQYGEELKNTFASGPRILQEANPINIISINKTSIGSNNTAANELVYEIGQPSDLQRIKGSTSLTKTTDGRLYIFNYETSAATFEGITPTMKKIIQSFEPVGLM
jgi:PsbP-like protein